uniref:DUF4418 family protein n=1 Tax=Spirosoma aureum TaxID=2692134 RepID=UPI0037428E32
MEKTMNMSRKTNVHDSYAVVVGESIAWQIVAAVIGRCNKRRSECHSVARPAILILGVIEVIVAATLLLAVVYKK